MNWMRLKILALTILTGPVFGAEKFLLNPAPDEDYLIKINDGGVIKDLMRFDADTNKVIVDGDLEATGVTTGFTAASAAPDWLTATPYGLNEIVVDPNSGITYRANVGHTSTGTNLTDDVSKYDIIGSASNGVIVTGPTNISLGYQGFQGGGGGFFEEVQYERIGSSVKVVGRVAPTLAQGVEARIYLPNLWTINHPAPASGVIFGRLYSHLSLKNLALRGVPGQDYLTIVDVAVDPGIPITDSSAHGSFGEIRFEFEVPVVELINEGVTVSIQDLTERTKFIRNGGLITSGANGNGVNEELVWAEKDSTGNYLVHFELQAGDGVTTVVDSNYPFSGITPLGSPFSGVCSVFTFDNAVGNGHSNCSIETTGSIQIRAHGGVVYDLMYVSGTINVGTNKPTWFDSNRENPAAVSAFVPEATASVSGIVGTGAQTFAGDKTLDGTMTLLQETSGVGELRSNAGPLGAHTANPGAGGFEIFGYQKDTMNKHQGGLALNLLSSASGGRSSLKFYTKAASTDMASRMEITDDGTTIMSGNARIGSAGAAGETLSVEGASTDTTIVRVGDSKSWGTTENGVVNGGSVNVVPVIGQAGILSVTSHFSGNGNINTRKVYAVSTFGNGNATQLSSHAGITGNSDFSVSISAGAVITLTNNFAGTVNFKIAYHGTN